MTNAQKKTIEREFYRYKENKQLAGKFLDDYVSQHLVADYSKDRVNGSGENGVENGVVEAISRETAIGARARKWAIVYEKTRDKYFCEGKDKLMQLRFQERRSVCNVCMELHIERRTYFYWLEQVLNTAFVWAQALGIRI